ncbi:hypothetical protein VUR80DRAFT_4335 [Thermomyces stellatus]
MKTPTWPHSARRGFCCQFPAIVARIARFRQGLRSCWARKCLWGFSQIFSILFFCGRAWFASRVSEPCPEHREVVVQGLNQWGDSTAAPCQPADRRAVLIVPGSVYLYLEIIRYRLIPQSSHGSFLGRAGSFPGS